MPAWCSRRTASAATSGVCSAGLATTAIAGHQRRRNLAEEDRQRKIPRRYRDEHATAAQPQHIALAGRARHGFARPEQNAALRGVVAAEIGGFADFRQRIVQRLAALVLQQRDEVRRAALQQIGGIVQDAGAGLGRRRAPGLESGASGNRQLVGCLRIEVSGRTEVRLARRDRRDQLVQRRALAEFDAARIDPLRLVEIARQGDMRVPRMAGGADDLERAPQQGCDRHGRVGGDRHE